MRIDRYHLVVVAAGSLLIILIVFIMKTFDSRLIHPLTVIVTTLSGLLLGLAIRRLKKHL